MKKPPAESVATTEVATTNLPTNFLGAEIRPESGNILPQLKLVWPIEIKPGSPFKKNDSYSFGLYDGSDFHGLVEGYTLSVIASRNMARVLVEEDGEKVYKRAYSGLGVNKKTADEYAEMVRRYKLGEKIQLGYSFVVAVLSEGKVSIAVLEAAGVTADYIGRPLARHSVQEHLGLKVKISDHMVNLKTAKNDPTKSYLDPKKFTQHETVSLGQEDLEKIAQAFEAASDKFNNWLNQ